MRNKVKELVAVSLKNQYTTLVYLGNHSEIAQEMFANAIAGILVMEYDTTQDRLNALARMLTIAEVAIRNEEERL